MTRNQDTFGVGRLVLLTPLLILLGGCEVLIQDDRPFETFENIPNWLDEEFRAGGENLTATFGLFGRSARSDARQLSEDLAGIPALVDREVNDGSAGLAWQTDILSRGFHENAAATGENVLGAPDWIVEESASSIADLERFTAEQAYTVRVETADLLDELERFFLFLFR